MSRIVKGGRYNSKGEALSGIKWEEKNYPMKYLGLVHYKPRELCEPHKSVAKLLFLSHVLSMLVWTTNFINNWFQFALGMRSGWMVLVSFLFGLLYNALQLLNLAVGLRFYLENRNHINWFQSLNSFLVISYLCFSVFGFFQFNGFSRIGSVNYLPIVLCVIEAFLFIASFIFQTYHTFLVFLWYIGPADIQQDQGPSSNLLAFVRQ